MKRLLFPILALAATSLTIISCRQDSEVNPLQVQNSSKVLNPNVTLPANSLLYDEFFVSKESKLIEDSRNNKRKTSKIASLNPYASTKAVLTTTSSILTSDQIVVTVPQKTFIGGVYNSTTLDNLNYTPISYPLDPITVSYSFPSDFIVDTIERPSLSSMRASVFKAMRAANFSGEQSLAFDYNIKQFSYYSELKIAFGSNVNIGKIFSIDISGSNNKIKRTTGVFAKFTQKNFTIDMDLPADGNIFKNNSDLALTNGKNPVYISSVTYGRLGIISIESNASYNEVNFALKAALTAGIVNGSLNIDSNSKKILEESDLSVYLVGGRGTDAVQVIKGFAGFSNFIVNGGQFTPEAPGVPIYFSASHASDNSVYYTTFTIDK
ncbi:hemolysin [Elizabethkingia anophelis]|uniref:thiol-activated cytolysin family protein n=1 Tax=Elizabethkingia anophelis TaxID=1117645 RepID=UPI00136F14CF|nr:thiol-activated cytolysin family protein [Elizabethkingia anophelis]MYY46888.1 hemolysin [Elizabethkingia anophelis]